MSETAWNPPEDADLAYLRSGGQQALAELYQQHRGRLHRMVELRLDRRLQKRVDASDVLQEGFVEVANRLDEFLENPTMPFFVWLRFLVGQRLSAIQRWHFQRQKRDPRREEEPTPAGQPSYDTGVVAWEFSASMTSPSQAVLREELARKIQDVLEDMDDKDREVLVLRHFEELTNAEIASELKLTPAAASKRYIRALARLKQATG